MDGATSNSSASANEQEAQQVTNLGAKNVMVLAATNRP